MRGKSIYRLEDKLACICLTCLHKTDPRDSICRKEYTQCNKTGCWDCQKPYKKIIACRSYKPVFSVLEEEKKTKLFNIDDNICVCFKCKFGSGDPKSCTKSTIHCDRTCLICHHLNYQIISCWGFEEKETNNKK